VNTVQ